MPGKLHYSNSPLTEASIEISVTNSKPNAEVLEGLHKAYSGLKKDYPISGKLVIRDLMLQSHHKIDISETKNEKPNGYNYKTLDDLQIVGNRIDGFSFTRLAPYDRWETFSEEAKRLWVLYRKRVKPDAITYLSLRYINQINIPVKSANLSDYFLTVPQISSDTPEGGIGAYFFQLLIPQPSLNSILFINQAMRPPETSNPEIIPIILDLQLVRQFDIPQSTEEIWALFEQYRIRKNQVFEAAITDKTRELIK